ncbi:hypothetical protein LNP04_13015 [Chryseobacterium sp. C-71]|uniref:hypothetical protein n=1 Tax=Chryseobacterium sp. C-71 TaxID=2893882 RepID=UPI001E487D35|nr:hypothetical protein [Chryseobacterium sp. C-71]UFH30896.1 hypothetical protein LNP04_13015 [Chryseobacterium sp. C-71]
MNRISLNKRRCQNLLIPELEKAESAFKSLSKKNANGKVVDYGNGVSIDTDDVIYIENGANYHTYTFNIKRQNAPEGAPLENLLLSPLPDGTYQEFLVTYNLTAQERKKVRNGEPVNTNGKTTITELAKGSFSNGGQLADTMSVKLDHSQHDIVQMHNQVQGYLPIFSFGDIFSYYYVYQYAVVLSH